jgi:hypothetical protein
MKIKGKHINIVDLLIFFIANVSFINIVLLVTNCFYPSISLIIGIIITIAYLLISKTSIQFKDTRFNWIFIVIVLISIFLRLAPNLYLTGGQDQGTYVSLSKQYEENHSLYITDNYRESFSDEMKVLYDKGMTFLGVEKVDQDTSKYVMPFYPVFPSWMSIFSSLFGSDNRVYALSFFGVFSVIGIYLLAYEISGRRKSVGLLASLFLSINPLHLYFSRIPVTEIVSLTFLLFGLYYLIKFLKDAKNNQAQISNLYFSLTIFNAFFYTRMNGVFFLPLIVLVPLLLLLFVKNRELLRNILIYSFIWIVLFVISLLFYRYFLPDLYSLIWGSKLLSFVSYEVIFACLAIVCVFFIFTVKINKIARFVKEVLLFLKSNLFIFVLIIFFSLIFYELFIFLREDFTNNYSLFSKESLSFFKQLNFLIGFLYLSPFLFVLLPISFIYFRKTENTILQILISYISIFLIYYWGVMKISLYHYYFARYQLSELIPLAIILVSIFLVDISKKRIGKIISIIIVSLTVVYFGFFSAIQLRDIEGANKTVYEDIKEIVGDGQLIILPKQSVDSFNQVIFPIKYYYGLDVFPLRKLESFSRDKSKDTYILSTFSTLEREDIHLVKKIEFKHNYFVHCYREDDRYFKMVGHSEDIPFCKYMIIPNRYYYGSYTMYLYEWK